MKPLVVAAGDPNLIPEVIVGGFGSFATPFLLQVIPALSKLSSASLPVTFFDLKSTKTIWESVPPVTISIPFDMRTSPRIDAFFFTCWMYVLNSGWRASPKATALAAITCISGPPCKPGKTELLNFFPRSKSFESIIPPLGPLIVLWVVDVTTCACGNGSGYSLAATKPE